MKDIHLEGITYAWPIPDGTAEWYYAQDHPVGDLYEAEELAQDDPYVKGNRLFFIHYPDGEVICPVESRPGLFFESPVWHDGVISFPAVDFPAGKILIWQFDCGSRRLAEPAVLPLSDIQDCYNLKLHEHPLTLTRQPNDGTFELIWPERRTIAVGDTETFFHRDGDRLFFSAWYEDPDYREEVIIRDAVTGEIREKMPGDILFLPNGDSWHIW